MQQFMIVKLAAFGATNKWVPMARPSTEKLLRKALEDLRAWEPLGTFRVLEKVPGPTFIESDEDNVLVEEVSWRMWSPEEHFDKFRDMEL